MPLEEEDLLRSVAMQNASSIHLARQRAEQALRLANESLEQKTHELAESLSLIRATLEATDDAILVTDAQGQVIDFNQQFLEMWHAPFHADQRVDLAALQLSMAREVADSSAFLARFHEIDVSAPQQAEEVRLIDGRIEVANDVEKKCRNDRRRFAPVEGVSANRRRAIVIRREGRRGR